MADNTTRQQIIVGVDGSASALQAARWAGDEAARRHLPVRVVHAVSMPALSYGAGVRPPDGFSEVLETQGRQWLADAEAAIRSGHPDLEIHADLATGSPVTELLEAAADARLVALGSRGLGGFSGMLTGSTVVAMVARGRCPIVVVRGGGRENGPVVLGMDGSPANEPAIAVAFDEASSRGADLVAVHSWLSVSAGTAHTLGQQLLDDFDALEGNERELLAERLAGWQEKYPDVTVRRVVARDHPVRCLLDHSADAQLLVVGSRGLGGFSGMLTGSTSQALIHHATCPLLVVQSPTP
ncbi:universal stress protein [Amycolatopsis sp. NBC_01286]|uniref:universal stress protein n=1 Tax=Amycolatopsis sp. NBC_01286 TaxID=2903560 RepID=UPI002E11816A|nr:universal stress protein [Amycolatopsis sp. NBC_01286]